MVELPEGTDWLLIDGERVRPIGHLHALVASRTIEGHTYAVTYEFNDENGKEEWLCTCDGFTFRHDCRHVRAVDRWVAGKATSVNFLAKDET